MKQYISISQVRSSLLTHLSAISLLATISSVQAEEISIENPSFESPAVGSNNLSLNPSENAFGWVPWVPIFLGELQEVDGSYYGALGVNPDVNNFYDAVPPDEVGVTGAQVGLLYNPISSAGQGVFGMEQELNVFVSEEARIYRLSVDVGNPRSNNANIINLDGFPNYRVQLLAGDSLIYESWHSLDLEEGTFGRVVLTRRLPANSALAGEELSIRLINENYQDNLFEDPPTGDPEVNFDNVRLEIWPEGGDGSSYAYNDEIRYHSDLSGAGNDSTDWDFNLNGKGKKRLLITGAGTSLHDRVRALAQDPFLTLTKSGKPIHRNDDWTRSNDAKEIREILSKQGVELDPGESAMLVELGAGDYTATLSTQGELGVYSGLKIYDLDVQGKLNLRFYHAEKRLLDLWNGKGLRLK